jgi:hypothetical protein
VFDVVDDITGLTNFAEKAAHDAIPDVVSGSRI